MSIATILSDGSGYKPRADLGTVALDRLLQIVGQTLGVVPLEPNRPYIDYPVQDAGGSISLASRGALVLPQRGKLRLFVDRATAATGLLLIRDNAELEVLYRAAGDSPTTLSSTIATSSDGGLVAIIRDLVNIVLVRTDGTTFADGRSSIEYGLESPISGLSLTFVGSQLLFTTMQHNSVAGPHQLWRLSLTGAAPPQPLRLPDVEGTVPNYIDPRLVRSELGSLALVVAGVGSQWPIRTTVVAVDADAGLTTAVTATSGRFGTSGPVWGKKDFSFDNQVQLALSPGGKSGAYVEKRPYAGEGLPWGNILYTFDLSSATRKQVPIASSDDFTGVTQLRFVDEDTLIFAAGPSYFSTGWYKYELRSGTLVALSRDRLGSVAAAWLSPDRKYLYSSSEANGLTEDLSEDLAAFDLSTGDVTAVTQGAHIDSAHKGLLFASCSQAREVYFAGSPDTHKREFFVTRGPTPAPARQLTVGNAQDVIRFAVAAPSCGLVAFVGGVWPTMNLFLAQPSGQGAPRAVTRGVGIFEVAGDLLIGKGDNLVAFVAGPVDTESQIGEAGQGHQRLYVSPSQDPDPQPLFPRDGASPYIQLLAID